MQGRLAPRKTASVRFARVSREGRFEFDRAYLDRLAARDPDTERHFTRYFGDLLAIKLRSRLRSPALIEDARQETFLRVLKALRQPGGIQSPGGFGAFVNSVCNNVLFEMYRANARTTPLEDEYDEASSNLPADSTLVADEEREEVRAALHSLPEREQLVLKWVFFDERDKDDICRDLQIDRAYLRVLVHRAKARFREHFAQLSSR